MAFTKLGKVQTESNPTNDVAARVGVVGGAVAINNQFRDGNITGRRTLYHGTDPKNMESILRDGIQRTTEQTAVNTKNIKELRPEIYAESLGKSYVTPSKLEAAGYSAGAQARSVGAQPTPNAVWGEFFQPKGTLKVNLPDWKHTVVKNPETAMGFAKWYADQPAEAKEAVPKFVLNAVFNGMDRATVVDGDISPKYIKGAPGYAKNSIREVAEFLRSNKGRAVKGYGIAGLGGLAMASGGKYLYDKNFK